MSLFLLLVFAGLIGNAAACLAGGLAGSLALAAATVFRALAQIAGLQGNNSLHVQIDSLTQTIKEKTDLLASLQLQNAQTKEELENSTQLASSKDELIKNQMESIKMIKTEREKIKAEKEQLELKYNQVSVDSKMLEGEIDMLFTVLTTIIKKDKKGYETYVDKLSEENKLNIKALVEKFPKLFK